MSDGICYACDDKFWCYLAERMRFLVAQMRQPISLDISSMESQTEELRKLNITDKISAKKWIIVNHPDKGGSTSVELYTHVVNYYKSCGSV
jgi:hypothetical protein